MPRVKKSTKNICVVISDKAQLGRLLPLMREIRKSSRFRLQLLVMGGAVTYRFGNVLAELEKEGFIPDQLIPTAIEGGDHLGMAKSAALGMLEAATAFHNLETEIVVVRGDRFEILPVATAAAYLNKALVHIEGGDKTGSIDESVRHAITKLAHLHFVTNARSEKAVKRLGESKERIHNVGSLDIDYVASIKTTSKMSSEVVNSHGVGALIDLTEPFAVVMINPVTTETGQSRRQAEVALEAVHRSGWQAIWIWPNIDAGSDAISKMIREWQVKNFGKHRIRFIRYLEPSIFVRVLNQATAVVGNSSTGIKECSYLGVPAVNIGSRQTGRLQASNVMNVEWSANRILQAMNKQQARGRYRQSRIYGDGRAAKRMIKILERWKPAVQK